MINQKIIDTITQYETLLSFKTEKERKAYFQHQMMFELKEMWDLLNVPLKAKQENGYDVLMATKMLGYLDVSKDQHMRQALDHFRKAEVLELAKRTLDDCLEHAFRAGLKIDADEIKLGIYIADPEAIRASSRLFRIWRNSWFYDCQYFSKLLQFT